MNSFLFRDIVYNDAKVFEQKESSLRLKENYDNILFLSPFESLTSATIYDADPIGIIQDDAGLALTPETDYYTIVNQNPFLFGNSLLLKANLKYDKSNFAFSNNELSISFWLSNNSNNAKGERTFNKNIGFTIAASTVYGFEVIVDSVSQGNITFTLEPIDIGLTDSDTLTNIHNKLYAALFTAMSTNVDGITSLIVNDKIVLETNSDGRIFSIQDITGVESFITFMNGISDYQSYSKPLVDQKIFSYENSSTDYIRLVHKNTGALELQIVSGANTFTEIMVSKFNLYSSLWNYVEICMDASIIYFFINGRVKYITNLSFDLNLTSKNMIISATNDFQYKFFDLCLYNETKHLKNYTGYDFKKSLYFFSTTNKPYADINFEKNFDTGKIKDFTIEGSRSQLKFLIIQNNVGYYYLSGAWRTSDKSFLQSNTVEDFELNLTKFSSESAQDFIVRAYFDTDGSQECSIDNILIETFVAEGEFATVIGEISLTDFVDLTGAYEISIQTSMGYKNIDLSVGQLDITQVPKEDIVQAINDAKIPDLDTAYLNSDNKIVLKTLSRGDDSFIRVYEGEATNALPIIWGEASKDYGLSSLGIQKIDYSDIFNYVRRKLGAPISPVELSDLQLEDALRDALSEYNRWRNFKEEMIYVQLEGNSRDGYEIPSIVGGEENIIEVIMAPTMPFGYYQGKDDLIGNLYVQTLFGRRNILTSAVDYYLTIQANTDLNILLNQQIKISYMNGKMFISPAPPASYQIAIKFRSSMTLDEIFASDFVRKLTVAESKITLGTIRSTFGGQIPGGENMLQLNGDALIASGTQEREAIVQAIQKMTQPYEFLIG